MDVKDIERNVSLAVSLLKSLSNEKRLRIVCELHKGEKSVGELEELVGLSQSALSQHLARLRKDNIVKTRRDAQIIYYSLHDEETKELLKCLCSIYTKGSAGIDQGHGNSSGDNSSREKELVR